MLPLAGYLENVVRSLLRRLPLSDYQKTRLWATSIGRPAGRVHDWAYYRCAELATRAFATPQGYQVAFPGAGDPESKYSMLEFGVANGNSLQIMLHFRDVWLKHLRLRNPVTVAGFDTFEGIPAPGPGDEGVPCQEGDFSNSNMEALRTHLSRRFRDFKLIKGKFADSLPQCDQFLRDQPPVFVSIDCDYYSSTMDVFSYLLPDRAPHGCLFYFDDASINFWSEKTGELRAVPEVNRGAFGQHIQLVEYPIWIETREMRHYRQIYRLLNLETADKLAKVRPSEFRQLARDDRPSPL